MTGIIPRPPTLGDRRLLAPRRFDWAITLGWMVLLFFAVAAAAILPLVIGGHFLPRGSNSRVIVSLISAALSALAYWWLVRLGEGRRPDELGWSAGAGAELGAGLLGGVILFSIVAALLLALGLYTIGFHAPDGDLRTIDDSVRAGVTEEIWFRAIILRLLWRAFGGWWGIALSAALFGGLHLANPHATLMAAIAIAIEAGALLGAAYALTGRLWMAIGFHAAWNFTQGWIYGAPVSGGGAVGGIGTMTLTPGASELLSGGGFGPEASLIALIVAGSAGAVLLWRARTTLAMPYRPAAQPVHANL